MAKMCRRQNKTNKWKDVKWNRQKVAAEKPFLKRNQPTKLTFAALKN